MKIIDPSYKITKMDTPQEIYEHLEASGKVCYAATPKAPSAEAFVRRLVQRKHMSVIEHAGMSVEFVTDRGVSHQLVRHRLNSYAQQSTRYCNFNKNKFGSEITVVRPPFWKENTPEYEEWLTAMLFAEKKYMDLIALKAKPEEARSVLPNSLATTIVVTSNFRQWAEIFRQRCASDAHPQIRQLMQPLLLEMREKLPAIFEDVH